MRLSKERVKSEKKEKHHFMYGWRKEATEASFWDLRGRKGPAFSSYLIPPPMSTADSFFLQSRFTLLQHWSRIRMLCGLLFITLLCCVLYLPWPSCLIRKSTVWRQVNPLVYSQQVKEWVVLWKCSVRFIEWIIKKKGSVSRLLKTEGLCSPQIHMLES